MEKLDGSTIRELKKFQANFTMRTEGISYFFSSPCCFFTSGLT